MEWDEAKQDKDLFWYVKTLLNWRKTEQVFGNHADIGLSKPIMKRTILYMSSLIQIHVLRFVINNSSKSLEVPSEELSSTTVKRMGYRE